MKYCDIGICLLKCCSTLSVSSGQGEGFITTGLDFPLIPSDSIQKSMLLFPKYYKFIAELWIK